MDKKKIIIICSSVIVVFVLLIGGIALYTNLKPNYLTYTQAETKITEAAKKYYDDHKDLKPSEDGTYFLQYSILVENKYIKPLNKILKNADKCSVDIKINKQDSYYDYATYIDCGDDYKTKELYKQILDTNQVVTSGNGLYKTENNKYYFKGEVNNIYVRLSTNFKNETSKTYAGDLYKIIEIDENNNIKLLSTVSLYYKYSWDDRYNEYKKQNVGYNDYEKSRIRDSLIELESDKTTLPSSLKSKLVTNNLCIGERKISDTTKDGSSECSKLTENKYYISMLYPYEYLRSSLDSNCVNIKSNSCANYNYLSDKDNTPSWTTIPSDTSNYEVYSFNGKVYSSYKANKYNRVFPVLTLSSKALFKGGNGSQEDPYVIK